MLIPLLMNLGLAAGAAAAPPITVDECHWFTAGTNDWFDSAIGEWFDPKDC